MVSSILLQLARGIWFMDPMHADAYFPVVKAMLSGQKVDFSGLIPQQPKNESYASLSQKEYEEYRQAQFCRSLNMADGAVRPDYYYGFKDAPKGSVSMVPVRGAIMKYDYCGSPGTRTIANWLLEADSNPNIIGHIIEMDSPGGSADGTGDLASVISNLDKPVVTFSHGLMCSAGYWIGSSAKEIICSNSTNLVGSIGTYMTLEDWRSALEKEGIKLHEIYATKSVNKNLEYREAISGNYDPILKNLIDPFNESFLTAVKRNRKNANLSSETLTGKTYLSSDAKNVGLIDHIGNLQFAIQRVKKLSKS